MRKGSKMSPESIEKGRLARTGKHFIHKNTTYKNCIACGKEFKTPPSRLRLHYCSQDCYWKSKKGISVSPQTQFKKGNSPWNKGKDFPQVTGKKCHLWKGEISFLPYPEYWTRTLRKSIRERDNYTCQMCGKLQDKRKLSVHHIDYDKKNCNPTNLITLCLNCHTMTNFNREKWIIFFTGGQHY